MRKRSLKRTLSFATDSNFFSTFSFEIIKGDQDGLLSSPNDMVVTESTAQRYFGNENPIGKVMTTPFGEFKVTGVCEDVPANSHLRFDILVAVQTFPFFKSENYTSFTAFCYFKLLPKANVKKLRVQISANGGYVCSCSNRTRSWKILGGL